MEKRKSRILIEWRGTWASQLAKASLEAAHPTFALVRHSAPSDPTKAHKLHTLYDAGATLLKVAPPTPRRHCNALLPRDSGKIGSLQDEAKLLDAIRQVDVVICAISSKQVLDQKLLIPAIKQAGCIKGSVVTLFNCQVSCWDWVVVPMPDLKTLPRDKAIVFGDGNARGEGDVAAFTISTVDDPRTLNKVLYLRPPGNVCSMNDLVEMWETKIKKKLDKIYMTEEELLKKMKETPYPDNMKMVGLHDSFLNFADVSD
ncbi:LOW QUALITY PROTEIN: hypothetical protein RJ639_041758 [Escallonia herrerae]|uniref:NmrA-like domain-containing protein n=1 Tax=Escallonia herrerae TaxID=1293975 RepID=A0AA88WG20_9ASTE|nr:LOW QUALITY PROTEIN: hypothetical protein RJ639_041758 [Escallonia herrerae]